MSDKLNILEVVVAVMEDEIDDLHEKVNFLFNDPTVIHAWNVHNLKKGQKRLEEKSKEAFAGLTDFAKSNYGS
jgi:riboflavin synthase